MKTVTHLSGVKRRLNWIPDIPDRRDFRYVNHKEMTVPLTAPLASQIDLRENMPPVVDQGSIGSCTANAIAGGLGFLELQQIVKLTGAEQFKDGQYDPISRLFIYWNERAIEGDTHQDAGAMIRDGMQAINVKGICRESVWPYSDANLFVCPPSVDYGEGWHHKVLSYWRLDNTNVTELKTCLAQGFPFVFGISVYESFMGQSVAESGLVPMPAPGESMVGGHAILAVGYDDQTECFIVRNSWGTGWGDRGYCYIPYEYLTDWSLADDFWTVRA